MVFDLDLQLILALIRTCGMLKQMECIDYGFRFSLTLSSSPLYCFGFQVCLHMFTLDFLNQVANALEKDSMSVTMSL